MDCLVLSLLLFFFYDSIQRFRVFPMEEQLAMVMSGGIYLKQSMKYNLLLRLFAYYAFYVEVVSNCDMGELLTVAV